MAAACRAVGTHRQRSCSRTAALRPSGIHPRRELTRRELPLSRPVVFMGQARMEAAMTYQDRDSHSGASGRDPRTERGLHPDPTLRATPRQAMWSWVATAAIVFILGVVFYGINTQRTNEGGRPAVTASPAPTTSAAPTRTGGKGDDAGRDHRPGRSHRSDRAKAARRRRARQRRRALTAPTVTPRRLRAGRRDTTPARPEFRRSG